MFVGEIDPAWGSKGCGRRGGRGDPLVLYFLGELLSTFRLVHSLCGDWRLGPLLPRVSWAAVRNTAHCPFSELHFAFADKGNGLRAPQKWGTIG